MHEKDKGVEMKRDSFKILKSNLPILGMVSLLLPFSAFAQYVPPTTSNFNVPKVDPYANMPMGAAGAAMGTGASQNPFQNGAMMGGSSPYGTQPQLPPGVAGIGKTPVLRNEGEMSPLERLELQKKNDNAVKFHEYQRQQNVQKIKNMVRDSLKDSPEYIDAQLRRVDQQFGAVGSAANHQEKLEKAGTVTTTHTPHKQVSGQVPPSPNAQPSVAPKPKDETRRIFELNWKAANEDNADGQFNVGKMMFIGQGVEKNERRAMFWMEKAGSQGHATAINELVNIYLAGGHFVNAKYWLEKQEEKGNVGAMEKLAYLHDKGLGTPKDDNKAFEYQLKAANRGSPIAQLVLYFRYVHGLGVEKDGAEAVKWGTLIPNKDAKALEGLEALKQSLTPEEVREGEKRAAQWVPVS